MTNKQTLLSLLAASTLATVVASACGGSEAPQPSQPTDSEHETTSGGEAEASCGGGACGAVDAAADEEAGH